MDGGRVTALEDVCLDVPKGGTVAIIGPSGCGKSTLLRILAGIAANYEGEVSVAGAPVNPKVLSIGFIPQNYGLLPWKNVRDNIRLSWRVKHPETPVPPDEEKMLSRLGIGAALLSRFPRELSGGQQQRASLARAFLLRPDILLMDEPFSALDAITREEMQEVFFELWRAQAVTAVIVTHDIEEALYLGQSVAVLSPAPGRVTMAMENPYFARRETSGDFAAEKARLRGWLTGKGATA
ncbi:MAG: ATP-binding cassette domain-containing protein [Schwartzia sp.]|nr:ATP-binding cassette domain-containing protein [Schwartzia sp. (in: firmicutes)]